MEKDWRLGCGQEEYLKDKIIIWKKFKSNYSMENTYYEGDHGHCEFCSHRFMQKDIIEKYSIEDCSSEGYCTIDGNSWICEQCYNDFKELFKWKIN